MFADFQRRKEVSKRKPPTDKGTPHILTHFATNIVYTIKETIKRVPLWLTFVMVLVFKLYGLWCCGTFFAL